MLMKFTSRNFLRCAVALCMLMSSCGSEVPFPRCVSADNFNSNTTVAVSAYYSDSNTNAFRAENGENGNGTTPGATRQVVRWQDTGLVTDGNEIVVKVQGAWVPWEKHGNKKSSPIAVNTGLVRPADLSNEFYDSVVDVNRVCNYTKYNKQVGGCDLQCSKIPENDNSGGTSATIVGRPCWLENGYGAYLLFKRPGDEDPNASLELMQFPESPTTHLAYEDANSAGEGSYTSNGKIYCNDCQLLPKLEGGWKIYVKILDDYYHDNAGGYSLEFTKGVISADATDIFEHVRKLVRKELDESGKKIFEKIAQNQAFKNLIYAVITLFLILTALAYAMGMVRTPLPDLIIRMLKVVLVLLLISPSSWDFFYNHLLQLFIRGVDEIIVLINSYSIGSEFKADRPFAFMDIMIRDKIFAPVVWEAKARALIAADWSSIFALLIIIIAVIFYIGLCVYGFVIYLTAFVAITFLVSLMPILFVGILFPRLRSLFDGWLTQCISFSMQAILMFTLIAMFSTLIMHYYYRIFGFTACYNEWIHLKLKYLVDQKYSEWTPGQKYDTIKIGWAGVEDKEYPSAGSTARYTFTGGGSVIKVPPNYEKYDFRYVDYPFLDPDTESNTVPGGVVLSEAAAKSQKVTGIDRVALLTNSLIAAERQPAIERLIFGIDKEFESIQKTTQQTPGSGINSGLLDTFKKKIKEAKDKGDVSNPALKKELVDLLTGKILTEHTKPGTPLKDLEKQYDYNIIKNIKQGWIVMWSEVFGLILMAFLVWQMRAFVQHLGVVLAGGGMMSRTLASMYGEGFTRIFASAPVIGRVVDGIDRGIDGVRLIARDKISNVTSAVSRLPERAMGKIPVVGGALSSIVEGTRHVAGGLMLANTEEDIYTMKSVSPRLDYARAWMGAHLGRSPLDALKYVGAYAAARATGSTSGSLLHNFKQDRDALLRNLRTLTVGVDKHKPSVYVPKKDFDENTANPFRRPDDVQGQPQQRDRSLFDGQGNLHVNRENFWHAMDTMHALNVMRREAESDIARAAIDRDIDRLRDEISSVREQRPGEIMELQEYVRPSGDIDFAALEARALAIRAEVQTPGLPPRERGVDGLGTESDGSMESGVARLRDMEETGRMISDASVQGFSDPRQLDITRETGTEDTAVVSEQDLGSRSISPPAYDGVSSGSVGTDAVNTVGTALDEGEYSSRADPRVLQGEAEVSAHRHDVSQILREEARHDEVDQQARAQPEDLLHDTEHNVTGEGQPSANIGDSTQGSAVLEGENLAEQVAPGHDAPDQASGEAMSDDMDARRRSVSESLEDPLVQEGAVLTDDVLSRLQGEEAFISRDDSTSVDNIDRSEEEAAGVEGQETTSPQVEDLLADVDQERAESFSSAGSEELLTGNAGDGERSTLTLDGHDGVLAPDAEHNGIAELGADPQVDDALTEVEARARSSSLTEGEELFSGDTSDSLQKTGAFADGYEVTVLEGGEVDPMGIVEQEAVSPVEDLLTEVEESEYIDHPDGKDQLSGEANELSGQTANLSVDESSAEAGHEDTVSREASVLAEDQLSDSLIDGEEPFLDNTGGELRSSASSADGDSFTVPEKDSDVEEPEGAVEQETYSSVEDILSEIDTKDESYGFGSGNEHLSEGVADDSTRTTEATLGDENALRTEDEGHDENVACGDAIEHAEGSAGQKASSFAEDFVADVDTSEDEALNDDRAMALDTEEASLQVTDVYGAEQIADDGRGVIEQVSSLEHEAERHVDDLGTETSYGETKASEGANDAEAQIAVASDNDDTVQVVDSERGHNKEQSSEPQSESKVLAVQEAPGKTTDDVEIEETLYSDVGYAEASNNFDDLLSDFGDVGSGADGEITLSGTEGTSHEDSKQKSASVTEADGAENATGDGGNLYVSHAAEVHHVHDVYVDVSKKEEEELIDASAGDDHATSVDQVGERDNAFPDDVFIEAGSGDGTDHMYVSPDVAESYVSDMYVEDVQAREEASELPDASTGDGESADATEGENVSGEDNLAAESFGLDGNKSLFVSHAEEHSGHGVYVDVSKKKEEEELEHSWADDERTEPGAGVVEKDQMLPDDVSSDAVMADNLGGDMELPEHDHEFDAVTHLADENITDELRDAEAEAQGDEEMLQSHHETDESDADHGDEPASGKGNIFASTGETRAESGGIEESFDFKTTGIARDEDGTDYQAEYTAAGSSGKKSKHEGASEGSFDGEKHSESGHQNVHGGVGDNEGDTGVSSKPDTAEGDGPAETRKRHYKKGKEFDEQGQDSEAQETPLSGVTSKDSDEDMERDVGAASLMGAASMDNKSMVTSRTERRIVSLLSEQSVQEQKKKQGNKDNVAKMRNELSNLRSRIVSENLTDQELQEIEKKIREIEGKINELDSE